MGIYFTIKFVYHLLENEYVLAIVLGALSKWAIKSSPTTIQGRYYLPYKGMESEAQGG